MDKCIYNGEIISAYECAQNFEKEREIRENYKLLRCCDPECNEEIIFRNGAIREAHFAHKNANGNCCYNSY